MVSIAGLGHAAIARKSLAPTHVLSLAVLFLGFALGFIADAAKAAEGMRPFTFAEKYKGLHIGRGEYTIKVEPAFEDYAYMLHRACDAMNLRMVEGECLIYPLTTFNLRQGAIATVEDGNDVIVYDRSLSKQVGFSGAMGIIAHELGHHYCRHLYKPPSASHEIEADRFSGAALRLAGFSRAEALAMTVILSRRPSAKHPARHEREKAILEGWNDPDRAKACR